MDNENDDLVEPGHDLTKTHEDPFIELLHRIIRVAVRIGLFQKESSKSIES